MQQLSGGLRSAFLESKSYTHDCAPSIEITRHFSCLVSWHKIYSPVSPIVCIIAGNTMYVWPTTYKQRVYPKVITIPCSIRDQRSLHTYLPYTHTQSLKLYYGTNSSDRGPHPKLHAMILPYLAASEIREVCTNFLYIYSILYTMPYM